MSSSLPDKRNTEVERAEAQKVLREQVEDAVTDMVPAALSALKELVVLADSESVRLDAVKTVFKMTGTEPSSRKDVRVTVEDDRAAVQREMESVLGQLRKSKPDLVDTIVDAEVVSEHQPAELGSGGPVEDGENADRSTVVE